MPTSTISKTDKYIIPSRYPKYRIAAVTLSSAQEYFQRLHNGKMTPEQFARISHIYNIDTTRLYKGELKGNRINVFTAIDSVNKYVIVDANNNYSFLDDKVYTFPLKQKDTVKPQLNVQITKFDGQHMHILSVPISIDAYDESSGKTDDEKKLGVAFVSGSMRIAQVQLNNKTYQIGIDNRNFGAQQSHNTDFIVNIKESPDSGAGIARYDYLPDYDLDIGGYLYHIKQLTDQAVTLTLTGKASDGGGRIYTTAPTIDMQDIDTNKPYSLDLHSGKYTVIDFWGSWCHPCIDELPMLVSAHEKYSGKLNFVSIALDYGRDTTKLKSLIAQYKLNWPQLWVDKSHINSSPNYAYKVDAYPTTILLDPNGLIVYRGVGSDGFVEIIKILQNKLGE